MQPIVTCPRVSQLTTSTGRNRLHSLVGQLPKLKGLAKYAAKNLTTFRRIEAISQTNAGGCRKLDLTKKSVRLAIETATSAEGLYSSATAEDYAA